jgi:cobalamin biosynthesis protein CobW
VVDGAALAEGRFAADEEKLAAQRAADPNLDHEDPIEELFEDQLNCADMVLLNKADLLSEADLARLSSDLGGQIRKGAKLIATREGKVDPAALIGLGAAAEADLHTRLSHHEMEGEEQHDHDDFESFVVDLDAVKDRDGLIRTVNNVLQDHEILRLKGFVDLAGNPSRLVIQAVGPRIGHWFDRPWRADEQRRSALVVIGLKGLDRDAITRTLKG